MRFLDNLDPKQKKMLMIGAPVVGIAAIYSISRGGPDDGNDPSEVVTDATGGTGTATGGGVIPGGSTYTPGGQSTGAIGVGELSSFLENVSDALGTYKDENAEAIARLRSDSAEWQKMLEESITARFDQEKQAPTPTPSNPAPPAEQPAPTVSRYEQRVRDLFARYGVPTSFTHGPTTESASDRVARIARSLEDGTRSYADIEKSVKLLGDVYHGRRAALS